MRFIILLFCIFFSSTISIGQINSNDKVKKLVNNSQNTTSTKPTLKNAKPSIKDTTTYIVKLFCDATSLLYINGDRIGQIQKDVLFRTRLPKGIYKIKATNNMNAADFATIDYMVNPKNTESIQELRLQEIITKRINKEAAEAELAFK
jgi:hypothetical protein